MIATMQPIDAAALAAEWDSEPATAKQIRQMRRWQLTITPGLTKRAAYRILAAENKRYKDKNRAKNRAVVAG